MTAIPSGLDPNPWSILPFGILLFCIAAGPFIHKHHWERHYGKIAVGLSLVTTWYYGVTLGAPGKIGHALIEYGGFLCLMASLFVATGGIRIELPSVKGSWFRALFLLVGGLVSNVIGTTGASMLLIRPWMALNEGRHAPFHTVFFIFLVSNAGGCLTPIGDPPLFLGYLQGIPFFWFFRHLWKGWLLLMLLLLAVFLFLDQRHDRKQSRETLNTPERGRWRLEGGLSMALLGVIVAAVFWPAPWRELGMVVAAATSYVFTKKSIHESNGFHMGPVMEVAWLFLGIFVTMVPALDYLAQHADQLRLSTAMDYFLSTGVLSALLDNAPSYMTMLAASMSQHALPEESRRLVMGNANDMLAYLQHAPLEAVAISIAAVWFGAMTYIGNGPNLMVKSIVEQSKRPAPSFFSYLAQYALPILLPCILIAGFAQFWLFR